MNRDAFPYKIKNFVLLIITFLPLLFLQLIRFFFQKSSIDLHENDKERCLFKGDQMWFQDLCEVESTPICQKVLSEL